MQISQKQRDALSVIHNGGIIRYTISPGKEHGGFFFETKDCHKDLDGRTARGLKQSGLIQYDGDNCWIITQAGRDALAEFK